MQKQFWWFITFLLLAGCSTALPTDPIPQETVAETDPTAVTFDSDNVPPVDSSKHSVPLEEIYFDTFRANNRAIPLTQADSQLILRLRDAIPPLHYPAYEAADEAQWLSEQAFILGYAVGDEAWAYPLNILNYHEIVNDTLGGHPVLISYCPLCYSGVVHSREHNGKVLTFGNTSALYESDMVMLDYETGSYWWQLAGQAIVGELNGQSLTMLPSQTISWGAWKAQYPETKVLSLDTGFNRDYQRDSFANYDEFLNNGGFAFPVSEAGQDKRLEPGTRVLAIKSAENIPNIYAYALTGSQPTASNTTLDDVAAVVFIDPAQPTGAAYQRTLPGQTLTFSIVNDVIVDDQTQSTWNFAGRSTDGALSGTQLTPLLTKTTYWFALIASEPTTQIMSP